MGQRTARILAGSDVVSEIVIAGRNLEAAKRIAGELGEKATALQADAMEEGRVASLATGYDLLVSAAGPDFKVVLPALRAAIKAGAHYCDPSADGPAMEKALTLDASAKASGVSAIVGIGLMPGLSNLLMLHAARQLDRVEDVTYCSLWPVPDWGDPTTVLSEWRKAGHADGSWQTIMRVVGRKARQFREGRLVEVDPTKEVLRVAPPQGGEVTAIPVGSCEPITLPRVVTGIRSVSSLVSLLPPQLNELWRELGRRIAAGEVDESEASFLFYERLAAEPDRWLTAPEGVESKWVEWAEAVGTKSGRRVRYRCWPDTPWETTSGPLATAALKILRGEIRTRGVLTPEACLEYTSFLADGARNGLYEPPTGNLLRQSIEELE